MHEIVNTYSMRVVTISRYDTGGSFLTGYHTLLEEMWSNSLPRRIMKICLARAMRYSLGRQEGNKRSWLRNIQRFMYELQFGGISFADFLDNMVDLFLKNDINLDLLTLLDDVGAGASFARGARRNPYEAADSRHVLTFRGKQSVRFCRLLSSKYKRCFVSLRHDRYYGSRRLVQKGVERRSAHARYVKVQGKRCAGATSLKSI